MRMGGECRHTQNYLFDEISFGKKTTSLSFSLGGFERFKRNTSFLFLLMHCIREKQVKYFCLLVLKVTIYKQTQENRVHERERFLPQHFSLTRFTWQASLLQNMIISHC
jgi:hypothetical protein